MKKFTESIYILEKLGQGGMGEVFKAKIIKPEQGFEKIVALKVLPEYTHQAEKKKEALLKEARIVANLNHANINQVFDVGEKDGSPYIIMDLIEGHDLREIINTAKEKGIFLSTSNCIEVVLPLLDALEYAHGLTSPIIHRDISPHNVMLTNQGVVKLLDFGLSKIQETTDQSKTEGYIGKYSYLPLEVIEGKTYRPEHDVYAVGLILYELLTLEKVYGGNLELEIIGKIKEGHVASARTFNPKISNELDELLKDWINPKEAKRLKDIGEIRKGLLRIRKELVSTSSLREEISSVFSGKANFKETVIEKRNKDITSFMKKSFPFPQTQLSKPILLAIIPFTLFLVVFLPVYISNHRAVLYPLQGKYIMIRPQLNQNEIRFNEERSTSLEIYNHYIQKEETDLYGCKTKQKWNILNYENGVAIVKDSIFTLYEKYSEEKQKCIAKKDTSGFFTMKDINVRVEFNIINQVLHFRVLGVGDSSEEIYNIVPCRIYEMKCWK